MADDAYHLKKAQEVMEKALDHEQKAEFSVIAADLIMDELREHPEVKGTKVEKDFLRRHKKHIAAAKWHGAQIVKLEKKYNSHMKMVESTTNKENN